MPGKFDSIIFDFDYTLADSSKGVVECVNYALAGLNLPLEKPSIIHETIGYPLEDTYQKLTGENNSEKRREFQRLFIRRADEVMAGLTILYPCVPESLRALAEHGLRLGIVSGKFRYRIHDILKRDHLLDFIEVVIGGEDVTRPKPDPAGLFSAMERMSTPKPRVLFVGDSLVDAETAMRGGVAFAAVLSGVTKKEAFANYPALNFSADLKDMTEWILR
ncbi:MAG: HAD-IA family hydrolase [Anaerolineales bacterium]|nr:HAD-IA family hydrolase [Anaerolineales bacterium]